MSLSRGSDSNLTVATSGLRKECVAEGGVSLPEVGGAGDSLLWVRQEEAGKWSSTCAEYV